MRHSPLTGLTSFALASALLLAAPREAQAIERQHHFGLDPSLALLKVDDKSSVSTGFGVGAHYTYGVDDQFNFMAELNASFMTSAEKLDSPTTPHTRPNQIGHALVGVGYVIDILRWVPYVGVLVGGYRLAGGTLDSQQLIFGAAVQGGLDYQLSRQWAVGAAVQQHILLTQLSTYPSYTSVMLRLEYMWGY